MKDRLIVEWIRANFEALDPELNERSRRRWAAVEAISLGRGGMSAVSEATGLSRDTVRAGVRDLQAAADTPPAGDIRCQGGGVSLY